MSAVVMLLLAMTPLAQDTVRLESLHAGAIRTDPRAEQLALQLRSHQARLANLGSRRLPQLLVRADATHQSDVPALAVQLPGVALEEPPHTRFNAVLAAEQLLYDGGALSHQEAAERVRYAELAAELDATLYPLRLEVNEAYFTALLQQVRDAEVQLLQADLAARLEQVRSQVRAGAALPGDTAALQAELLRAQQLRDEISAARASTLNVLSALSGAAITGQTVLVVPDLEDAVAAAQAAGGPAELRLRPEFARLQLARERLGREADAVSARARPQLHGFAQAGVGRPGPYQLFSNEVHEHWQLGVRVQWQPWTWGGNARDRELLSVQQQVLRSDEAALAARLEREVQAELESMQRLQRATALDEQIIALREQVERVARRQFEERALTASQYVTARTDVLEARVAAERHRIELERARARYLTIVGAMPSLPTP